MKGDNSYDKYAPERQSWSNSIWANVIWPILALIGIYVFVAT